MSDPVKSYMIKIREILNRSKDALVREYPEMFIERIETKAMENWVEHGEPNLSIQEIEKIREGIWNDVEKIDINSPILLFKSKYLGGIVMIFMN